MMLLGKYAVYILYAENSTVNVVGKTLFINNNISADLAIGVAVNQGEAMVLDSMEVNLLQGNVSLRLLRNGQ